MSLLTSAATRRRFHTALHCSDRRGYSGPHLCKQERATRRADSLAAEPNAASISRACPGSITRATRWCIGRSPFPAAGRDGCRRVES